MIITLLIIIAFLILLILLARRDGYLEPGMRMLKQKHLKKAVGNIYVTQIETFDSILSFSSLGLIRSSIACAIVEIPETTPWLYGRTRFFQGSLEFRFVENFDDAVFSNAEDIGTLILGENSFSGNILCSKALHEELGKLKDTTTSFSMRFSAQFHKLFLSNRIKCNKQTLDLKIADLESISPMDRSSKKSLLTAIAQARSTSPEQDWPALDQAHAIASKAFEFNQGS
jgi:hypothetical protein